MANQCPNCGGSLDNDPRFCPACGQPITDAVSAADAPYPTDSSENGITIEPDVASPRPRTELVPDGKSDEKRLFIPSGGEYGDSARYEDAAAPKDSPTEKSSVAARSDVSLYISIFAAVLSVTAMVLVILFAVVPSNRLADNTVSTVIVEATPAPTQKPTEPLITGVYRLTMIDGDSGIFGLLLRDSTVEMRGDYTGSLMVGDAVIGGVTLDDEEKTAVLLNLTCTYTFDGRTLTFTYRDMTLVYKKS